jgi:hypothetical protein
MDEPKVRKVGLLTWEAEVSIGNSIYYFQSYLKNRAIKLAKNFRQEGAHK